MYLITITNTICKTVINYFGPFQKRNDYSSKYWKIHLTLHLCTLIMFVFVGRLEVNTSNTIFVLVKAHIADMSHLILIL